MILVNNGKWYWFIEEIIHNYQWYIDYGKHPYEGGLERFEFTGKYFINDIEEPNLDEKEPHGQRVSNGISSKQYEL
jgi:hypothetical protein